MLIVTKKHCLPHYAHFLSECKQSVSLKLKQHISRENRSCPAGGSGGWNRALWKGGDIDWATGTARHEAAQTLVTEEIKD